VRNVGATYPTKRNGAGVNVHPLFRKLRQTRLLFHPRWRDPVGGFKSRRQVALAAEAAILGNAFYGQVGTGQ